VLRLDCPKDSLYNSAGVVPRQDITGRSGSAVGEVLTGVINFTLDKHQNGQRPFAGDSVVHVDLPLVSREPVFSRRRTISFPHEWETFSFAEKK